MSRVGLAAAVIVTAVVAVPASRAHADVDASGAYTTRVDIEVPPYHGLEPHLAIAYSSSAGDGLAGVGWQLEAGSTIVRATRGRGAPRFDANDIFLLDGVELVPCQMGSASPSCNNPDATGGGQYYSTKVEDFRRIKFLDGTWYVWGRDGRKTTLRAQSFGHVGGTYRWATTEVRDTHDNHVDYIYACDAAPGSLATMRECYLDKIRYGHGAWLTILGGLAEISMSYQMRSDPMTYAMGGDLGLVRKQLTSISVRLGSSQVRAYRVRYASSATTGRSLLAGIQEFGRDALLCAAPGPCTCTTDPSGTCQAGDVIAGTSLPEHTFTSPSLGSAATDWALASVAAATAVGAAPGMPWPMMTPYQTSNWYADNDVIVIPADVNGDGRTDFVYPMVYNDGTSVNAISFSTAISGPDGSLMFVDDYFQIYWPMDDNGEFWNTAQWFAGDFNHDHAADVYMVLRSPTCRPGMTPNGHGECPHATIAVAQSKGDGHYDIVTKETTLPFEAYHRNVYALTISAYAGGGGGGVAAGVSIGLTNGGGGGPSATSDGNSIMASSPGFTLWYNATVFGDQRWAVADANGDGRDDVMVATVHDIGNHNYDIGLQTAVVTGNTFDDSASEQMTGWTVVDTNVKKSRMFAADVNGDGRADWMVVHDHEANRSGDPFTDDHVALNVAINDAGGTMFQLASIDGMGPWDDEARWLPSDVDGDGRADFVRISRHGADAVASGEHAAIDSFLSEGTGLEYRTGPTIDTGITWLMAHPWCTEPAPETMYFGGDYDGDGRGDVMAVWGTNSSCAFNGSQEVNQAFILSRPGGWSMSTRATGQIMMVKDPSHPTQQAVFAVGDVNGDGTSDLLFGKGHGTTPYDPYQTYDVTTLLSTYPARDTQRYLTADVTGDGRDDLVLPVFMNPGYRIVTQIQQSDGSFLTMTTGTPGKPDQVFTGLDVLAAAEAWRWMIADVGSPTSTEPDGKADLVYVDYPAGVLRIYTLFSVGDGGWVGRVDSPLNGSYPSRGGHDWRLMRLDSDGRADLVDIVYDNGLRFETFLANGDGTWTTGTMPVSSPYAMSDTADWRAMDVNGDGRDELVYIRAVFGNPSVATEIRTFFATDDPSLWDDVTATPDVYNIDVNTWQPMELDGDGAIDLGRLQHDPTTGRLVIEAMLSRGNGTWSVEKPAGVAAPSGIGDVSDTARYRVADTNGDGLTDLVHVAPFLDGGKVRTGILVLEHDLSGWIAVPQAVDVAATEARRYRVTDLDADGSADVVAIDPGVTLIRRGVPSDRVATESNGTGATTSVAYRTATDVHSNAPPGLRLQLVTTTTVTNAIPTRTDATTTYGYDEARWSHVERRWLGFRHLTSQDGDAIHDQRFQATDECGLAPLVTALYDAKRPAGQNLMSQSVFDTSGSGVAPYTCLMAARQDIECEGTSTCRTTSQRWEYDEFGNPIRTFVNDLDADIADDRMTEAPVWPNGQTYVVSLPGYGNSYRCASWSSTSCVWEHMSSTVFEYDDNADDGAGPGYAKPPTIGELRRVRPWNNRDWNYPTTSYAYDGSGNVTEMTDPGGKVTSIGYDWAGCPQRYYDAFPCALKVWNPSGPALTTYIGWDPIAGKPNRIIDANGQSTYRTYDVLGRSRRTTDPTGRYTELTYPSWGTSSQRVRTETTDGSPLDGVLWSEDFFDGLHRIYKSRRESNGLPIVRESTFDGATDGLAAQTNEYDDVGARVWTTYEHDVAHRVTAVVNPDTSRRVIAYGVGAVTATDERDQEIRESVDTLGRIAEVRERLDVIRDNTSVTTYAYTHYTYDGSGGWYGDSVDTITDDAGNHTTTTRDSRALTRESCDPDRGCSTYAYRDDGLVEMQADAKWQTTRFRYDLIGRLVGKDYYDPYNSQTRYAVFAWDVDPFLGTPRGSSAGRLTYTVDSASSAEDRWTYDGSGRVSEEQRCVAGICGTLGYTFEPGGRIATIRYPDAELVTYQYDMAGELGGVPGYVSNLRHRPDGQPSLMCLTDSTCTAWGYDPIRQWLTSIDVMKVVPPATSSTTFLDRVVLGHDRAGLISAMRTTVGSTTLTRKYGYDSLGRLLGVTVAGQPSMKRAYSYDTIGNITSSTTQGTYSYDPTHVHAASATDALTFTHDANGNQEAVLDASSGGYKRFTVWDQDNRPSIVWNLGSSGWNLAMFGYDAGGERVSKDDAAGRTLYFGNLAELDPSGQWIKYYYVDGKRVARRDSTGVTYYHADHLGSPRLVTDASGSVVTRYDWQPYGELQSSSGPLTNNRTFTGALAETELGLIQMGARFYDPAIGQFISADSIIPDRFSPQTLNRYAYALDNPVSLIDPSGHQAVCPGMELCQTIKQPSGSKPGEWQPYAPEPPLSAPPLVAAPPAPPTPPPLVGFEAGAAGGPGDGAGGGTESSYANDGNTGAEGGSGGEPTPPPGHGGIGGDFFVFGGLELEGSIPFAKLKLGGTSESLWIAGFNEKGPYTEEAFAAGASLQVEYGPAEAYVGAYTIKAKMLCCDAEEMGHEHTGMLTEAGLGHLYVGTYGYPGNAWKDSGAYVGLKAGPGFVGIGMSWEAALGVVTIGSVKPDDVTRAWHSLIGH